MVLIQPKECLNWAAMRVQGDLGESVAQVPTLTSARTVAFFFHAVLRRIMIWSTCLNYKQAEANARCWKVK